MSTDSERKPSFPPASLWASAFVLLGIILLRAGDAPRFSQSAHAGLVSQSEDMTILTADTGNDQDYVVVLDRYQGLLLVYMMRNRQSLDLVQSYTLDRFFETARTGSATRP